ncbi:Tetraspanin-18 [Mactra antiquata]
MEQPDRESSNIEMKEIKNSSNEPTNPSEQELYPPNTVTQDLYPTKALQSQETIVPATDAAQDSSATNKDHQQPNTGRKIVLPPMTHPTAPALDDPVPKFEKEPIKSPELKEPIKSQEEKSDSKTNKGPDNSLLGFLGNIGIVIVIVINIISLIFGIALIVVGAYVKKMLAGEEDIMNLLDIIDLGSFTLKQLIMTIIGVIIGLGVFAIILSLMGGIGAFFTLRIVIIIIDSTLHGLFDDLLKEYRGPGVINLYSIGWDLMFVLFGCCGVDPITAGNNDFQSLPTVWWTNGDNGNDTIPYSCCKNVPYDNIKNYLNYTEPTCTENLIGYHKAGCYDFFADIFEQLTTASITITTILFLVEIVAVLFSIFIVIAVFRKKKVGIV